jgi:Tfp pilus assembly protein PilV
MRALAMLLVAAGVLFGIYQYHLKNLPTTDSGTVATQAINLTGVRSDLLQIAQAERANLALNGKCASLDELTSTSAMAMTRTDRGGYTYQVNCMGSDFQVVAEHPPAAANSGIRYPKLAIDATMQLKEVE